MVRCSNTKMPPRMSLRYGRLVLTHSFTTANFTINLTDVNESAISAISDSNVAADTVLENATVGTVVGITALATDADGTDTVTYSLDDNAGGGLRSMR